MRLTLRYIVFSGVALVVPLLFILPSHAQERCATVLYSKNQHPDYELRKVQFERWITEKKISRVPGPFRKKQSASYKIPVVVHVIHNGEPIGTGSNITDAQILSQLRVLNEDFTRQNADAVNTPAVFSSIAGSLDIEFVLAKQDPDGLPTNGIVRVNGGRPGWTVNDNYTLKNLSYWDAEQYMNIWVCNLTDQFVGYAQHPESDLEGLENSSTNRLTDGVVIWHRAFGSIDDGAFSLDPVFNKGRTATHEVGHFFGLFHIWGDESACNGTDYVTDTPNQGNRTVGCPSHPRADNCSQVVMFQNFLDYTDDVCMNLFTQGQVERMSIVIENSPRRSTLLTSPGLDEPAPLANDLGVRNILFPDASVCSNLVTPVIEVRNYGSNTITGTRIRFILDGVAQETLDFPLSLDPDESAELAFSDVTIPSGSHTILFQILQTNGGTDGGSYNDIETSSVIIPTFGTAPFALDLSSVPAGWITQNFDGQITWSIANAPGSTSDNMALKLNYFQYEDKIGEIDVFLSPVFDLSTAPAATLTFDVAHARYQSSNDRLKVVVLTDCQGVFEGTTVYNKAGDTLRTAQNTTTAFTPSGPNQWRKELVDLNAFLGEDRVQIAFVGINDWGNNIYVDNIALSTDARRDIAVVRLAAPAIVLCDAEQVTPSIVVRNAGTVTVDKLIIEYSLNGGQTQSTTVSGLDISVGAEAEIALPMITPDEAENTLAVHLEFPEGESDYDETNNDRTFILVVNNATERIPLRQNFEGEVTPLWTIANPSGDSGMNWEVIDTNMGRALYFNAFDNDQPEDESWFVSPVLDLSRTEEASMVFDLSYNRRPGAPREELVIVASTDCGQTFEELPFNFPQTGFSTDAWLPSEEDQWFRNIRLDLGDYVGEESVRIAFVVTNRNGNNLYLDNIEFFVSSIPTTIELETIYSVYGYDLERPELSDLRLTFNLPKRQDVRFSIVNAMGQMETDGIIPDVLNQSYPLNLRSRLAPGVYFIRLSIGGKYYSTKVLVH